MPAAQDGEIGERDVFAEFEGDGFVADAGRGEIVGPIRNRKMGGDRPATSAPAAAASSVVECGAIGRGSAGRAGRGIRAACGVASAKRRKGGGERITATSPAT